MTTVEAPAPVDGRHRRRTANREAVVEALLACFREGHLTPSSEEVAARAGISTRSLFRYFDDVDAMVRTAISRQQEHLAPLYDHGATADQPLDDRIDRFVAARVRLLADMGDVGRLARARSIEQPLLAQELDRIRSVLRAQLAELFGSELAARPAADSADTLAALDVATSWEACDLLRHRGLPRGDAERIMATSVRRLLEAGER